MAHYLDAAHFTKLFRQPKKNHSAICECINTLVRHLVNQPPTPSGTPEAPKRLRKPAVVFKTTVDRDDAIQTAVAYCIERIDRFDVSRPDANAFSYYTSVAINSLRKCQREQARQKTRAVSLHDVEFDDE